jgi:flavin reductase (DIM6/NTAB) family NADH-FMN oxidoreductase RutF
MTVNSFTSVSLTPPLVMVSLERKTRTFNLVSQARSFGVTILSLDQQEVSDCFAGRCPDHTDRFEGLETFTMLTGAPFIRGGLAFFDCQVVSTYDAGTHCLFIGEVLAIQNGDASEPLLYYNRTYRRMHL